MKETLNPPRATRDFSTGLDGTREPGWKRKLVHTGVDSGHHHLHDDYGQSLQPGHCLDDLSEGRQFRNHVQEHRRNAIFISPRRPTPNTPGETYVKKLRYELAIVPNRSRTHMVRMKPPGNFLLMMGARTGKIIKGSAEHAAYVMEPWTPAIVAISGYEKRIEEPIAIATSTNYLTTARGLMSRGSGRGAKAATRFPRKS